MTAKTIEAIGPAKSTFANFRPLSDESSFGTVKPKPP